MYLLGLGSLGVENRLGVIEEQDHLPRGQESLQRSQILGMFYPCTNGLGELSQEMSARGRELIAADESTVVTEPLLDPVVVEDGEGNRRLSDSACTNEGDWGEVFGETDDTLDKLFASEAVPRRLGRQFSKRSAMQT